ncbi:hypothetical protein BD779DRAFT_1670216 [Infundibulicybe gibba]|nr:hypothetical protein BD779DRAFT_1670216 [Infundibulicybe gibba]
MFHVPLSPSKGKGKDESDWRAGWWDFQPLTEHAKRPVEWSSTSIIFTAHSAQPLVTARHFSSSKQFMLPSPAPILSSPDSYEPPSIISAGPNDLWLFAYFPGRNAEGIACIWKHGPQVDSWNVKEWWGQNPGVLAATWLGMARQWSINESGLPVRLPPHGPRTPVTNPTLLLVTKNHQAHLCYFRNYAPSFKILSCSLLQPTVVTEGHNGSDNRESITGLVYCTHAAIGIGYNEPTILIAARSCRYPSPSMHESPFNNIDLSMPMDINDPKSPIIDNAPQEWESWGEESKIDLCEVFLRFDGQVISLAANPLPPIRHTPMGMTQLSFIPILPPIIQATDLSRSPALRKSGNDKNRFYLVASYLDFGDFVAPPASQMILYSFSRPLVVPPAKVKIARQEATRSFSPGVLTYFTPPRPGSTHILANVLDVSGALPRKAQKSAVKEVHIGLIKVLQCPNLIDVDDWELSPILSSTSRVGRELPLNAAISPNGTLICTTTSAVHPFYMSVHLLPKPLEDTSRLTSPASTISGILAAAILGKRATCDIANTLSRPSMPLSEVITILDQTLILLSGQYTGKEPTLSHALIREILGLSLEIYKTRATLAEAKSDQKMLMARWQAAHDMCSLASCKSAFEACKEGSAFDLDAVWQLIGWVTWVVNFTEILMKECVFSFDVGTKTPEDKDGLPKSPPQPDNPLDSPIFLHLIHPYGLGNFTTVLKYIQHFRNHVGSFNPPGEGAHIARDILVDLVDRSGIDFSALGELLDSLPHDPPTPDEYRKCLAGCQPTPPLQPHLRKIIQTLNQSQVLHKARLFIKPSDLVDGVSRLTLNNLKCKEIDVISKGMLYTLAALSTPSSYSFVAPAVYFYPKAHPSVTDRDVCESKTL